LWISFCSSTFVSRATYLVRPNVRGSLVAHRKAAGHSRNVIVSLILPYHCSTFLRGEPDLDSCASGRAVGFPAAFFEVRFVFCAQVCRFALYFALKAVPPPTLQFYFWHRAFTLCREIHSCARSTVPLRETASSSRNEYVMRSSPRERYRSMPCTHGRRECGSCKRWILCILLSGYLSVHCAFLCCMH
jgi:hypothetical protein